MDDCWSDTTRNATGHLQPKASQFPHGFNYLTGVFQGCGCLHLGSVTVCTCPPADYVHSRGLKIGLYTCIGTETCHGGRPGSFGNYELDAQTIAAWGMDVRTPHCARSPFLTTYCTELLQFTKTDNCNKPGNYTEQQLYGMFSQALNATGRPILFSLCEWGESNVESWGGSVGQMFRIQMDHLPFWDLPSWANGAGAGFGGGTANIIEYVATLKISQYNQEVRVGVRWLLCVQRMLHGLDGLVGSGLTWTRTFWKRCFRLQCRLLSRGRSTPFGHFGARRSLLPLVPLCVVVW
jgi:hypothetical protein